MMQAGQAWFHGFAQWLGASTGGPADAVDATSTD